MITDCPGEFLSRFAACAPARLERATLRAALLVTPAGFVVNQEATADNRYMSAHAEVDPERAGRQHAAVGRALEALGVPVISFPGRHDMPDGIYPNNVFATSARRDFVVGAMKHPARRREAARDDIRALFTGTFGYRLRDLSRLDLVAELTGPLVLDRARDVGLCGLSGRADEAGCAAMHDAFGLTLTFRFRLVPDEYHANIVLAVLAGRACVLHPPSFATPEAAAAIQRAYADRAVVIDDEEKDAFAGNCLAVTERDVLFSETALAALRPRTRAALERLGFALHGVAIDELEKGGGSLRCLIAEVF